MGWSDRAMAHESKAYDLFILMMWLINWSDHVVAEKNHHLWKYIIFDLVGQLWPRFSSWCAPKRNRTSLRGCSIGQKEAFNTKNFIGARWGKKWRQNYEKLRKNNEKTWILGSKIKNFNFWKKVSRSPKQVAETPIKRFLTFYCFKKSSFSALLYLTYWKIWLG